MKLQRHETKPILLPDPSIPWEAFNVCNPSVIDRDGLFHMWYRAQDVDRISRIGYAVSADGVRWNRLRQPVLEPSGRIDTNGNRENSTTPMFAHSDNLINWELIGPIVRGQDNKDHFLLPAKLGGRFVAFHRRPPSIWLAESDDLVHWPEEDMQSVLSPRPDNGWDSKRAGGNGSPIETEHGWVTLYHAHDDRRVYRIGVCLLDLENPAIVINRPKEPILEPEEEWELEGDVPNVVFSHSKPGRRRNRLRLLRSSRPRDRAGNRTARRPHRIRPIRVTRYGGNHG